MIRPKHFLVAAALGASMLSIPATAAFAAQPSQNCADYPSTPGNSATAPGSAFNPSGVSGGVYAGQQAQNSKNPKSVSQYDVACSHQP